MGHSMRKHLGLDVYASLMLVICVCLLSSAYDDDMWDDDGSTSASRNPYSHEFGQTTDRKLDGQKLLDNVLFNLKLNTRTFFSQWNPRNPNSGWQFRYVPPNLPLDNVAFLVNKRDKDAPVTLVTLPFGKYLPQTAGSAASLASYESGPTPKGGVNVTATQKLLVRLVSGCTTYNADQNPFPRPLVKNAWDDPRLGNCLLTVSDVRDTGIKFTFLITNKSVWASYFRDPATRSNRGQTWQAFDIWRRVAIRESSKGLVDVSVLYDRAKSRTDYFVNDVIVWTVNNIGKIPNPLDARRDRIVLQTNGADELTSPGTFSVFFGAYGPLDRYDPNSYAPTTNKTALLRLSGTGGFYGNMQFWDNLSVPTNKSFGQGISMKLQKIQISLAESSSTSSGSANAEDEHWSQEDDEYDSASYRK